MAGSSAAEVGDGAVDEPKVEVVGTDETCLTFVIRGEDHTLGNALRYVLMKNPDVEFCGYSIPHPSDDFVNIRVQTTGKPATQCFRAALRDLAAMSNHIKETFQTALDNAPTSS
jgi:DNA-directed RNA polymerases I and III subunit RPAC2